ncbi:MAG: tetratricopeptide repeat protein [Anaerolineae bacterium]
MDSAQSPEETLDLLAQAWHSYEVLQIPQALEQFMSVAQQDPENYEAQLGLTRTYIRMRNEPAAVAAAQRCIELRPERGEGYAALGVIFFLDDKLKDAQERLQKAIALAPEDPEPHLTLAQVDSDLHQVNEAMDELQRARRLVARIENEHLRRQLEASELHARTYIMLGQNKVSEAMASARALTDYEQENPYAACLAYSNLGLMEARSKHYDQAIDYLQRAYSMNPYFYRAGSALGRVLYVKGQATQAAQVLGEVVRNAPDLDAHTIHAYAAALAKSGQRAEARVQYQAALKAGLKGLEAVVALGQLVWLSNAGRFAVIALVMAAAAAWLIFGKPSPSALTFAGILVILIAMQQLLGRKRYK